MYLLEDRIRIILKNLRNDIVPKSFPVEKYKFLKTEETGYEKYPYGELDWPVLKGGAWSGNREHYWFVADVEIPDDLDGQSVVYQLVTGREDSWDAINPQFEVYVNGELVQGLDMNHRSVVLCENARAGERYRISLRAYSGDENPHILLKSTIGLLDRDVMRLYYDIAVPYDVAMSLNKEEKDHIDIINCLNETINLLDFRQPFSAAFYDSVRAAQNYITDEFYGKMCGDSKAEVWCVGHTHIDVAWLWTLSVTKEKALRSFSSVLALMKEYPEYIFLSSQPQLYRYVQERMPEVFEQIRNRVREGRWEPEGGMWLEADCNLASGEALVRQILMGKRYFKNEFGVDNKILWLPDAFGFSAALPQIMKKSGMSYFMTTKLSWNEYDEMPYDTFEWEGIDGSKVLTHFISTPDPQYAMRSHFTTYNGKMTASQVKGTWDRYQQKGLNNKVLTCFGFGDGGGGPTREMLETQRRLSAGIPGCPKTVMKPAGEFFRTLEKEVEGNRFLPTWAGELYLEFHRGTFTSMARNKKYNRKAEFLLENVEWVSSLNRALTHSGYPQKEINDAWTVLLRNQFHDILPGSAIKEVYDDSKREYEEIFAQGDSMLRGAASNLLSQINRSGDSIVVLNPLGFESGDVVCFTLPSGCDSPAVYETSADGAETRFDCQLIGGGKAIFYADGVPSKGYKTFAMRNEKAGDAAKIEISPKGFSNRFFTVELDEKGQFASVYDKRAQREVLVRGKRANVLTVYEDIPHVSDNWEIGVYYKEKQWTVDDVQSIEVTENGPVRACLKITRKLLDSTIVQSIYVYRDMARIDVRNEIDWHEKQLLLRASFPVDVHADEAAFDIQYGNIMRSTHNNTSWDFARFEVCAHKWMDLSEDGYGVSILNDCKYGCDVHDGVMNLTLIKSGIYPNPEADKERHEFVYSFYPHAGGWRDAGTAEEAYRLNNPMLACYAPAGPGSLPDALSFVACSAENVIVEAVKKAEDSEDYIVRLYECYNRHTKCSLNFAFDLGRAAECDLMENDIGAVRTDGSRLLFEIKPYEIKTFKISFKN